MKVMITGAGGMTGSELGRQAAALGWTATLLSRSDLDIGDATAVDAAVESVRPDAIVNAAGYTAVDRAESEPAQAIRSNARGPRNLARAAAAWAAGLVHISTDYVFDGTATRPYQPTDPVNPLGVYGRSKLAGEIAVREECLRYAIVRTSWVYSHEGHNFVRTMLHAAADGRELKVVDDQHGCPTAAADLAMTLLRISDDISASSSHSGTYHFSNSGITTWYEFAKAIFEIRGGPPPRLVPVPAREYPTAAPRPSYSALDTSTLESAFGITPRPWREALRDTMARIT